MAVYVEEVSRTFGEYLLIPGLTTKQCVPSNVSLRTPLVKHAAGTQAAIELNIPFVSSWHATEDSRLSSARNPSPVRRKWCGK